jgi:hypothetical protein
VVYVVTNPCCPEGTEVKSCRERKPLAEHYALQVYGGNRHNTAGIYRYFGERKP